MADEIIEQFDDGLDMSVFSADYSEVEEESTDETENIDKTKETGEEDLGKTKTPEEVASEETSDDGPDASDTENVDEEEDSEDTSGDGEGDSSPSKLYSSLADTMKQSGIFTSLDPEKLKTIKDSDTLMEALQEEVKSREYSELTDRQKVYLQGLRDGIPEEEVVEHINVSEQLNGIQDDELQSNEELRKALIVEKLKIVNNFSPEKAAKYAAKSIELGEDFDEATEALNDLRAANQKKFEDAQKEKKEAALKEQEKAKQVIENFRKKIDQSKEIFEGLEITKAEKEKLFNQMTTPVTTTKDGKQLDAISKARMENPEDFTMKLHYLFMATNGFKDINKFIKKSKTKAASELDRILRSQESSSAAGQRSSNVPAGESDFDKIGDIIA